MKPIARRGLGLLLILGCAALWSVTTGMAVRQRLARTCQGKGTLDVTVTDSLERPFVAREDIENWLDNEYRAYAGLPLDSVDLQKIEKIILGHSAVRSCEAWLTDDGILHIEISQRQPVVRFDEGKNGYYADAEGFLFPLQSRGTVEVPVVSGHLPLKVERGYKGFPEDEAQKGWLMQIIGLVNYMNQNGRNQRIASIQVDGKGDLVLLPKEGKEKFIFGPPVRIADKFALMDTYYSAVEPSKEPGWYKSVDLRFRKQLVCKK